MNFTERIERAGLSERVEKAIEEARDAFWASIAKSFPEATTGDSLAGNFDVSLPVEEWVTFNVPILRDEEEEPYVLGTYGPGPFKKE